MAEKNPTLRPGVLPLPAQGLGSLAWWQDALKASEEITKKKIQEPGKKNIQAYVGETKTATGDMSVNVDFYNTEQKKAQLFFRTPDLQLTGKRPGLEDAVTVFQPVLNHYLGPHQVNALAMMDECLFDVLCPAGIMVSKIGYEAIQAGTVPVDTGDVQPDPNFVAPEQPGDVLGLNPVAQAPMVPVTVDVPNIVLERYFWDRVSGAKASIPKDFHGSDYDRAKWLSMKFPKDTLAAKRDQWVPEDFKGSAGDDKFSLNDDPKQVSSGDVVLCEEIWYRAAYFDPNEKNPEKFRQLILVEGQNTPAVHRDSPYQRFDQNGKFIGGMKGNPIHIGAIRYVSDSAHPPSDCTISRQVVDTMGIGHTQMVKQRDRSLPWRWVNKNMVAPEDLDRLKKGDIQGILPVDGNGNEIIGEVARAQFPRENFTFDQVFQTLADKLWALGANQQGVSEKTQRSATELSLMQGATNTRLEYERGKVLTYYIKGAEKLGSLIQMFADQQDYIEIEGPDGEKRLQAWDKTTIQGEFVYSAKPDSAIRVDAASDRKQFNDYMNFNAKNPTINLLELTRIGAEKNNLDPARVVQKPAPPSPPQPAISFSFKGSDLGIPEVRQILAMNGIKLPNDPSPEATLATLDEMAKGQPHGGLADKGEQLSKHSSDKTGQLSGAGTTRSQASVQ